MMKKEPPLIPRRELLKDALSLTTGGLLWSLSGAHATDQQRDGESPPARPNLLFVFSDQQSFDMLGSYGNEQILTPVIDRFASESVRFEHCVSSCPICTPYRGMLLSGLHPLYNGCFTNDVQMLSTPENAFGKALGKAGYQTAYIGKWHIHGGDRNRPVHGGPARHGFDNLFLTNNCTVDFRAQHAYYWNEEGEKVFFDEWEPLAQTRQALAFLDQCEADKPFALFLSWHPPHDHMAEDPARRYESPKEYMDRYDPAKLVFRPNAAEHEHLRDHYHGYYAMCSGLDDAFGMLLEKLKTKGLDRNTLVVYTSDHGDLLHSHGRPAPKMFPEDESTRVPLILRWPDRLPAGRTSKLLVGPLDLMPTILELMGLPIPSGEHGKNLASDVLSNNEDAVESLPLFYYGPAQDWDRTWYGVYTPEYTYAYDLASKMGSSDLNVLFDRRKDRWQQTNLYGSTEAKAIRDHLDQLTGKWIERFEDPCLDGRALARLCFGQEKRRLYGPGETGILTGRPIDLAKAAKRDG
jgi:arylsulfatase A-like enzyme